MSGILGDKYDRTHIVAFGCFLWGIMTTAIGLSTSVRQVTPIRAVPNPINPMSTPPHQGSLGLSALAASSGAS